MTTINDYLDAAYVGDAIRRDLEEAPSGDDTRLEAKLAAYREELEAEVTEAARQLDAYTAMVKLLRPVMEPNPDMTMPEAMRLLDGPARSDVFGVMHYLELAL